MKIYVPKETRPGETRVSLIPANVKKLVSSGAEVSIAPGLGESIHISDAAYEEVGASIQSDHTAAVAEADLIVCLRRPPAESLNGAREGVMLVGLLEPFGEPGFLLDMAQRRVSCLSMEMIPRSTIAQKMDALSSQANLAGYVAVVLAAERLQKILPMMMTPAGTIAPARVFIIGVGVAGLQAIATAKRMGARVEAFDTRPVVEEQVHSLGAKFVKIDLGETGQTEQGYAKELTPEQQELQRAGMARVCAQSDVVITTAQLFGRPAPRIVTRDMVEGMKPGSVVIDLAIETGGNVEGAELDREVEVNGVTIVGLPNLPGRVPAVASQMYSANVGHLLDHFWDQESKRFDLKLDDEIIKSVLITHDGEISHPMIRERVDAGTA
jgi:NAD(P) transhydrogenase subunit alpha